MLIGAPATPLLELAQTWRQGAQTAVEVGGLIGFDAARLDEFER